MSLEIPSVLGLHGFAPAVAHDVRKATYIVSIGIVRHHRQRTVGGTCIKADDGDRQTLGGVFHSRTAKDPHPALFKTDSMM